MSNLTVSIGICAYNEEQNICKLLNRLVNQRTNSISLIQILVISCSNDGTNHVVDLYKKNDSRIELIVQNKREGKASAVNVFLNEAVGDVLVLISADTLPKLDTIEKLVEPFYTSAVGMTAGRPIPTNTKQNFMGAVSHFLWGLHHEISITDQKNPKCGEMIAFRNVINEIPSDTAVDEAYIEMQVRKCGFSVTYVPRAIVRNHGPETIFDFLKQRRRIHSGHLHLKRETGYEVTTMKLSKIAKNVPNIFEPNWKNFIFFVGAMFLELYGRLLGTYDFYVKKKNPYVWDMADSTKEV